MRSVLSDLAMLCGVAFLALGAAQFHVGLAWLVGGFALFSYGLLLGLTPKKKAE